jgi:hypothetical protein
MAQGNTEKFQVEMVAEALRQSGGIKLAAAQKLNCSAQTITNYVKRHPELAEVIRETKEELLDGAESALVKGILDKDSRWHGAFVIFYLKTQGKGRGYIERGEISGPNGGPVPVVDVGKLSDEELERVARRDFSGLRGGAGAGGGGGAGAPEESPAEAAAPGLHPGADAEVEETDPPSSAG